MESQGEQRGQERFVDRITTAGGKGATAEFLSKTPKRQIVPTIFSVLSSDKGPQMKVNLLTNIKDCLDDPTMLSRFLTEHPTDFFDSAILEAPKSKVSVAPSENAQRNLERIRTNFDKEAQKNRVLVVSGGKPQILFDGVDPNFLIEAIASGVFDKKQPYDFRKALMRSLVNASYSDLLMRFGVFGRGASAPNINPEERPSSEQRTTRDEQRQRVEEVRHQEEVIRLQHTITTLQHDLHQRSVKVVEQQGLLRELEEQLRQERMRPGARTVDLAPNIPTGWHRILDVIPIAGPERITANFRARQKIFHPDSVLASLEAAGVNRDNPVYLALKDFATKWTSAINNAYSEAKREGKVTNGGK